jgi:hypothetical protein
MQAVMHQYGHSRATLYQLRQANVFTETKCRSKERGRRRGTCNLILPVDERPGLWIRQQRHNFRSIATFSGIIKLLSEISVCIQTRVRVPTPISTHMCAYSKRVYIALHVYMPVNMCADNNNVRTHACISHTSMSLYIGLTCLPAGGGADAIVSASALHE